VVVAGAEVRITAKAVAFLADDQARLAVRLEADAKDFGPGRPVIPGMLAQVDILSGQHTVLNYLIKPVQPLALRVRMEKALLPRAF
jgi:adhesin transport system membrane fusion protein